MLKILQFQKSINQNIIANGAKIAINFINQILLIPLYITYWGDKLYSDWIILSAITSFFAMSDLGLNNATNNRFCISYAQGNIKECKSLLINSYIIIAIIGLLSILLVYILGNIFDLAIVLGLNSINNFDAHLVLIAMVSQVFLYMSSYVPDAIYNSHHYAAKATYINNFTRLFVSISIILCIILEQSIIFISFISLLPIIFSLIYKVIDTNNIFKETISLKYYNQQLLKDVLRPSLAFMSFPIGNMIIFQGFTFIVNYYFGSQILILFNTSRTLVNFIRTLVQTLTSAIKPEFSLAYGRKDYTFMKSIFYKILCLSFILSILIGIFILIFGPNIYRIWLANSIPFTYNIVVPLIISMIFNAIWEACGATLTSTNNHIGMGIVFVLSTFCSIVFGIIAINIFPINITLIASSLIISDLIMSLYTLKKSYKLFFT